MSTLSTANIQSKAANTPPVIKDLNGTECGTFCRAWVNFDGIGTVAIRDSFNVSSITDNGTGAYSVNFDNAMANANYCATVLTQYDNTNAVTTAGSGVFPEYARTTYSTTQMHVIMGIYNGSLFDCKTVSVAVFGG
jgi:hypothetical protein